MKRVTVFLFMLLLSAGVCSCEKDELMTDSRRIEAELKAFVETNQLTVCDLYEFYDNLWHAVYDECDFTIENGFLIIHYGNAPGISHFYFNLLYLYRYNNQNGVLSVGFMNN